MASDYGAMDDIKEESLELKNEPIDDYPDIKEEEPFLIDASNDTVNENESVEIKDELVNEFVDVIQDELIADMYNQSAGTPSLERSMVGNAVDKSCVCTECGKKLSNKYILKSHMLIHADGAERRDLRRFTCVVCCRTSRVNTMHEFTKNPSKRTIWVNAVRATPEGRKSLMQLLSVTEKPHLCESHFSPSDYNHKASTRILRINAVPSFQDPYEETCREQVDDSADVQLLQSAADKSTPVAKKSYVCLQCGKSLGNKSNLEYHMRIHTGRKMYMCEYCDIFFKYASQRNSHMRDAHTVQVSEQQPIAYFDDGVKEENKKNRKRSMMGEEVDESIDEQPGPSRNRY